MGSVTGKYLVHRKGIKEETSSWKIFGYALEVLAEFIGGLAQGMIVFTLATMFVGVTPDPTNTVVMTNDRWQLFLMPLAFALITMSLRGSFALSFFPEVFFNSWYELQLAVTAMTDGRFRKSWAKLVLPLLLIGSNSAGIIASAAWFKAMFGGSAISPYLIPTVLNSVQGSYGWSYLASALVYIVLLHIVALTYNSTGDFYGSLQVGTFATFLFGVLQFICLRQLPSFAFNWGFSYLTGFYDLLWIDIAGGFTGIIVTGLFWWFLWQPYFQLDQIQDKRNYHAAYSSAIFPPLNTKSDVKMVKTEKKTEKTEKTEEVPVYDYASTQAHKQLRTNIQQQSSSTYNPLEV